jgi:hypothetical protein
MSQSSMLKVGKTYHFDAVLTIKTTLPLKSAYHECFHCKVSFWHELLLDSPC